MKTLAEYKKKAKHTLETSAWVAALHFLHKAYAPRTYTKSKTPTLGLSIPFFGEAFFKKDSFEPRIPCGISFRD